MEITQTRFDIMVRRLKLSQRKSIILAKEMKHANILAPDVRVYGAIGHRHFTHFFKAIYNNSFAFCVDIRGLILTIHHAYNLEDWRLFHMTNSKNTIPIVQTQNRLIYH